MKDPPGLTGSKCYQATHDALTGLVNRREFESQIEKALALMPPGARHALCYLGLDRFSAVNYEAGTHVAGDALLREIAMVLRRTVGVFNAVARIGGDEFGVLLRNCPIERARQVAEDVVRAVGGHLIVWKGRAFGVSVSVGVVEVTSEGGRSLVDLMDDAYAACLSAKHQGGGRVHVWAAESLGAAGASLEGHWRQLLQTAPCDNRFELHPVRTIPIGSETDPDLPGVEIRRVLTDFSGAQVPPWEWMRAAERLGLTPRVDRWVFKTSITALARGAVENASPDSSVCIGIGGETLGDPGFTEFVIQCLETNGVAPSRICFEISSKAIARYAAEARRFMDVLHGAGCRFALECEYRDWREIPDVRDLPFDFVRTGYGTIRRI